MRRAETGQIHSQIPMAESCLLPFSLSPQVGTLRKERKNIDRVQIPYCFKTSVAIPCSPLRLVRAARRLGFRFLTLTRTKNRGRSATTYYHDFSNLLFSPGGSQLIRDAHARAMQSAAGNIFPGSVTVFVANLCSRAQANLVVY